MTGPVVAPRRTGPLRIFPDRAAAEAEGLYLNPGTGIVYERMGSATYVAVGRLRTEMETELAAALEVLEWCRSVRAKDQSFVSTCPMCSAERSAQKKHRDTCGLGNALKAYREAASE